MSRPQSQIGHGALGVRSGLRKFDELVEQTYCERGGSVDLLLGAEIDTTWQPFINNWYTVFSRSLDGVTLEVAGIAASTGEALTRKERELETESAESSFYYDSSNGDLYVHLAGDVDPRTVSLRVDFLKRYGSAASIEPLFGSEKLANADHQTWPSSTDLGNFNELNVGASGVTVRQVVLTDGRFAAEIVPDASGLAGGTEGGYQQAGLNAVAGGLYWVAGEYETDPFMQDNLSPRVRVLLSPVGNAILSDGRSAGAITSGIELKRTGGERRRFIFPFRSPSAAAAMAVGMLLHNSGGSPLTRGYVRIYNLTFMRVYRYEMVEPRIAPGSLPEVEVGSADTFMGAESVAVSGLRLLNRASGFSDPDDVEMPAGYFETLLGRYDVGGRYLPLRQGGRFDDGQEITFDDCWQMFSGCVNAFEVGDTDVSFQLTGAESVLSMVLPTETVGRSQTSEVSDRDVGRPRPILVGGPKYNMRPPRVALDPLTRLPIWEVNDPTFGNGTPVMGQVIAWAYTDEDSANLRDVNRRLECEFTSDTTLGRVTLVGHPGPFEVFGGSDVDVVREVKPNDAIDIVLDSVTYAVFLTPGLYRADQLTAHVQSLLQALVLPLFGCTYNYTTHQVNVGFAGANMTLLLSTGANKHRSAWPLLGFEGNADTSSLSQNGTALYDETRADQFTIRIDATGYRDHTDGRFTGITGGGDTSIIYKMPDILHFLWVKVAAQAASSVDLTAFVSARQTHQHASVIYLGGMGPSERLTVQQIIDRAEVTAHVDVSVDENGVLMWRPRADSAAEVAAQAAMAPLLTDRDFLEFSSGKTVEDTYLAVSLTYDEDAVTGAVKTREASISTVPLRHDQRKTRTFDTAAFFASDVQAQAWNQMLIGVLPRRRIRFRVKGRLNRKTVGDLIRVQRTRMLGQEFEEMLNADVFRILTLKKDPQTHVCTGTAYTADLPRNMDVANVISASVLGSRTSRDLAPFMWFVPSMAGNLSPYRPGRVGP